VATAAAGGWESVDEITVMIGLGRWWPTAGTRTTGRRNTATRRVVEGGRLVPLPVDVPVKKWRFPDPLGTRTLVATPLSEIITLARHLPASRIRTYLSADALEDLRNPATPAPEAVDETGRSAQRFSVDAVVRRGEEERRISAGGRDIYAVTAPLIVEAAQRLLDGRARINGVAAPGETFDAADFLTALSPHDLCVTEPLSTSRASSPTG
jgi:hypothetical protein